MGRRGKDIDADAALLIQNLCKHGNKLEKVSELTKMSISWISKILKTISPKDGTKVNKKAQGRERIAIMDNK